MGFFTWKRYTGNEHLVDKNGTDLPYTVLDFWQWSLSALELNVNRGSVAEFIVKSAMESNGFPRDEEISTGVEPYDLIGPMIESLDRNAHIEIKCTALIQPTSNAEDIIDRRTAKFGISPASLPGKPGFDNEPIVKQRNNDLYVFCLFAGTPENYNVLDVSLWEFYVLPTYEINESKILNPQKTISIARLDELGIPKQSFETLYEEILNAIKHISDHYQ